MAAGAAVATVVLLLATYIHSRYLAPGQGPVVYVVGQSAVELLFLMIVAPLMIARLRALGWPVTLAMILMPAWLFGPRNMALYDAAWNTGDGLWGVPYIIGGISAAGAVILLLLLLVVPAGPGPGSAPDS